jgi:hypothetical protein
MRELISVYEDEIIIYILINHFVIKTMLAVMLKMMKMLLIVMLKMMKMMCGKIGSKILIQRMLIK